jgi:hypothetical protein
MSNIKASEENRAPSTSGNEAYEEHQNGKERRKERTRYKVK